MAIVFFSCIIICNWYFFQGYPNRPIPENTVRWGTEERRNRVNKEIEDFMNVFVFAHTSDQISELRTAVEELNNLERDGYQVEI